jgi:hypothetical protein
MALLCDFTNHTLVKHNCVHFLFCFCYNISCIFIECGDYLGDMTDELSDKIGLNTITTFIGAGPKTYAYQLARPNHKGHSTKCVVKGITNPCEPYPLIQSERS